MEGVLPVAFVYVAVGYVWWYAWIYGAANRSLRYRRCLQLGWLSPVWPIGMIMYFVIAVLPRIKRSWIEAWGKERK